jgi:hypothetical protein
LLLVFVDSIPEIKENDQQQHTKKRTHFKEKKRGEKKEERNKKKNILTITLNSDEKNRIKIENCGIS